MPESPHTEETERGSQPDARIGSVLNNRYRIVRTIGVGGMGTVYEAVHELIRKKVAVKCLHRKFLDDRVLVERFKREAHAASAVGNEHIVDVTDMGATDDGIPFIVMEYLDGIVLSKLVSRKQRLTIGQTVRIALQICDALAAAHEAGVVHRDLKPENILLVRRKNESHLAKVLDFGISKLERQSSQLQEGLTSTGMAMGTPQYMSPEQAQAVGEIDHRTDIYSLGVILYRALTGEVPFRAVSFPMLVVKITTAEVVPLRRLAPEIPEELEQVVLKSLAKTPGARYQTMDELADALRPFQELETAPTSVTHVDDLEFSTDVVDDLDAVTPPESDPPRTHSDRATVATTGRNQVGSRTHSFLSSSRTELRVVGSAVGVIALTAGIAWAAGVFQSTDPLPAAAAAPQAPTQTETEHEAAAPQSEPAPEPRVTEVQVRIRITPEGQARVFLDGNEFANPAIFRRARSLSPVRLRVLIDGEEVVNRFEVFDRDRLLDNDYLGIENAEPQERVRSRSTERRRNRERSAQSENRAPADPSSGGYPGRFIPVREAGSIAGP